MTRILVITEEGADTGMGHKSRCEGLIWQLKIKGVEVEFIVNNHAAARERLKHNGFDGAIIDSYSLEKKVYFEVCGRVGIGLYIDDYKRMDYPPGIVLNSSIGAEELRYPPSEDIIYLLGPRFMPMRPDFAEIGPRIINEEVKNIFITFGGQDRLGIAVDISTFILKEFPRLNLNVVLGKAVPSAKTAKTDKQGKVIYHRNLNAADMIKLMQKCDIAISAGGQTLYELARAGIPTIGICAIENQLNNLRSWENSSFLKYCGWYNDSRLFDNLRSAILDMQDWKLRKSMSDVGQRFVDGKGAQRVAEKMFEAIHETIKNR